MYNLGLGKLHNLKPERGAIHLELLKLNFKQETDLCKQFEPDMY